MNRRDILRSVAGVAAFTTVGLAGCSETSIETDAGEDGSEATEVTATGRDTSTETATSDQSATEDSGACSVPSSLQAALPKSDAYERTEMVDFELSDVSEMATDGLIVRYDGPEDQELVFGVFAFESAEAARQYASAEESPADMRVGIVPVGAFAVSVQGPSSEAVRAVLAASPPLGRKCVENNVVFASEASGEPATDTQAEDGSGTTGPQASFSFDFDADAGELTITHQGGDVIAADQLMVRGRFDSAQSGGTWVKLGGKTTELNGETVVRAGDSVTVSAGPTFGVRVFWESEDGSDMVTLREIVGPEADEDVPTVTESDSETPTPTEAESTPNSDSTTGSEPTPDPPQASFSFDYDADAGELTITHEGGDPTPARRTIIAGQFDSDQVADSWVKLGGDTAESSDGPVVKTGDSVTVSVGPDYIVRVVWASPDGSSSAVLATHVGPGG